MRSNEQYENSTILNQKSSIFVKNKIVMIGAIIGDIIGSRFEFNNIRSKNFELFTKQSHYTDDTVETIAIADAILNNKNYKDSLIEWCKKYPEAGYSSKFREWIYNPVPYKSYGNGALMRISPIGYARLKHFSNSIDVEVRKAVTCSHNTQRAISCATALTYGIMGAFGSKRAIVSQLHNIGLNVPSVEWLRENNKFDATCENTLSASVACFIEADDFEDAIRNAVSIGGDTDTIANITGALAGAYYGVPQNMINKLKDYLPKEMYELIDEFVIKYQSIGVPSYFENVDLDDLPNEFKFLSTNTIFN